jgi:hypothetical protein
LETNITLLNDGSQEYICDPQGSKPALDLTFLDQRSALYIPGKLEQALGISTIFQNPSSIKHNSTRKAAERLLDCIIKTPIRLNLVEMFRKKSRK